jgi:hypothetical protein
MSAAMSAEMSAVMLFRDMASESETMSAVKNKETLNLL